MLENLITFFLTMKEMSVASQSQVIFYLIFYFLIIHFTLHNRDSIMFL